MEVRALLQQHKQMESMVSKMGKSGMMGGGNAKQRAQMQQMQKNPQAMMKQLQSNPQAMQMVRVVLFDAANFECLHLPIAIELTICRSFCEYSRCRHRCSR